MSQGDEDFVRQLEEQLRRLRVSDVLAQTVMTISQLAWQRLAGEGRDLGQARLAIEALRALVPVLKGSIPDDLSRDFQQAVSNLQLAYAGAVSQAEAHPTADAGAAGGDTEPPDAGAAEADVEAGGGEADAVPSDDAPPAEPVTES